MPTATLILNSGNLATVTTDAVAIAIAGADYATARFTVVQAGTATATAQISVDGGVNYIPAPYAKKVNAVSANPTVQPITATTLVTGDVWEVPLPGNATHFRLLCAATGTATSVSLTGGAQFIPGVPVMAVLYDVTSGVNLPLDTGTVDLSGWAAASHWFSMNGGAPSFSMQLVDDAGVSSGNLVTSAAGLMGGFGLGGVIGGTTGIVAGTSQLQPPRRMRYQSAAIAAQTSRIRLEARR